MSVSAFINRRLDNECPRDGGWSATGGAAFIIICPLPGSSDCASNFFCSVGLHFEAGKVGAGGTGEGGTDCDCEEVGTG